MSAAAGTAPPAVPAPSRAAAPARWQHGRVMPAARVLAEEVAVAFTYNRMTHAVMLASPCDLEDFAIGFSLSERIIARADEIEALEIRPTADGVELRMDLARAPLAALDARRRHLAGPSGCGLCGIDSLAEALREPPRVRSRLRVTPATIARALAALPAAQALNRATAATHAAALFDPARGLLALREDIGRHNALDKLAGAAARARFEAGRALIVTTSRVSVELVQKAALIGAPVLVAVSAPTALAVRAAAACGLTLAAVARADGFEVFTHPERIGPDGC